MPRKPRSNLGQVAATVRSRRKPGTPAAPLEFRRQLVADLCKLLGDQLPGTVRREVTAAETPASDPTNGPDVASLPPRLRQTLDLLLRGDSEKQIARKLELSPHTVHVYVKSLYRKFEVSSRGELLARWVKR